MDKNKIQIVMHASDVWRMEAAGVKPIANHARAALDLRPNEIEQNEESRVSAVAWSQRRRSKYWMKRVMKSFYFTIILSKYN